MAPADSSGQINLAALPSDLGALAACETESLRALALDPLNWLPRYNLALALRTAAADRAMAHLRLDIRHHPEVVELRRLLVHLEPRPDRKAPLARQTLVLAPADGHTMAALGVGLVSGDFRWHSSAFLLPPLLRDREPHRWRAHLYSNSTVSDDMTERFRGMSDAWTVIAGMDDEAAERRIRADGVDILIDLNGHTSGHRLELFARRPALVQATWLDYPGSTGLRQVDYAITDVHHAPPGTEGDYVESVVRLPHNRFCYEPPAAPDVTALPAMTSGRITFGCFNALYARDLPGLAALRRDLRPMMAASPLVDGAGFARAFADVLEAIVRR